MALFLVLSGLGEPTDMLGIEHRAAVYKANPLQCAMVPAPNSDSLFKKLLCLLTKDSSYTTLFK